MPARGTDNQWAKLDPDKVRAMRAEYEQLRVEDNLSVRRILVILGSKYETTPSNVHAVVNRKTWKTVE